MTQRYISAINYADKKAAAVLRKHAKKRPLGDIESKYGYTPPQPVLSCRTVDVDLSGTRTYRPLSTTDILQQQHKLIHNIYTKNRNIKSAPQTQLKESDQETNLRKLQRINIEVQGRPLTSLSQVSKPSSANKRTVRSSKVRPKTTGSKNVKQPPSDSFMLVRVDRDMLDSARSSKELTNQIHELWQPEHHDLNQGKYLRGQKQLDNLSTEQCDAWLTFGGRQDQQSHGVVDAFAGMNNYDEYYSIDGSVGNKVAATLRKGDKVRIGVNGVESGPKARVKKASIQPSAAQLEMFGDDIDAFNDIVLQNIDEIISEKKKIADTTPLNWTGQISKTDVKVVEPLGKPIVPPLPNLCESHPVVFEKLVRYEERPKLARGNTDGFQVKHRLQKYSDKPKYHQIKTISISLNSNDGNIDNINVDDILRNRIGNRNSYTSQTANFQKDKFRTPSESDLKLIKSAKFSDNNIENNKYSRSGSCKSRNSAKGENHHQYFNTGNLIVPVARSVPSTLPNTIDSKELMISAPGLQQTAPTNEVQRRSKSPSIRTTSAKSRSSRIGSAASYKLSQSPVDAEYIKFSSHIKNPKGGNSVVPQKQMVGVRFAGDGNEVASNTSSKPDVDVDINSVGDLTDRSVNSEIGSPPHQIYNGFSINIPTADMLSDRDSMLQSPYKRSEEDELTTRQRRDIDLRDEQINQITSMLAASAVTPES